MKQIQKIGIFGHYGNKNLGDEAIILAVVQNIRQRIPSATIVGFSVKPEDTAARYGIAAYPIRQQKAPTVESAAAGPDPGHPGGQTPADAPAAASSSVASIKQRLKAFPLVDRGTRPLVQLVRKLETLAGEIAFLQSSFKRLQTIDLLMITGSNQFLDNFGGPWGFPYTLLKWSILARAAGVKVYYVSVGAGPIDQPLSKTFIRWALKFANYVSLRDAGSARLLRDFGCAGASRVYPDLAHSLRIDHIAAAPLPFPLAPQRLPVVGINPMPLYDSRYWCEVDEGKYAAYVAKLVEFCSRLLDRAYPLFFFATQEKDNYVIEDILQALQDRRKTDLPFAEYVLTSSTVEELMANIAAADITVATRFHGTVLSLLAEKPMLGICYYRKAKELLGEMGQQAYAVELDSFTVEELWIRFQSLVDNREQEQARIQGKNRDYAQALARQYDALLLGQGGL